MSTTPHATTFIVTQYPKMKKNGSALTVPRISLRVGANAMSPDAAAKALEDVPAFATKELEAVAAHDRIGSPTSELPALECYVAYHSFKLSSNQQTAARSQARRIKDNNRKKQERSQARFKRIAAQLKHEQTNARNAFLEAENVMLKARIAVLEAQIENGYARASSEQRTQSTDLLD